VNERSLRYEGWRVAFASSVGVFVSFASLLVYTFGIFLKPLAEEFAWSREAVSSAFGIAAMTAAVCSPLLGFCLDRFGPRWIIVPSLTIFGSAFASLSLLTPRLWHLYAIFVILGMVANGTAQMAYARTVSSWFARRRGVGLAVVMSGGAVGAMVLPPVAQSLIDSMGWRSASMLLGTMVLVVGLPTVLGFVRERPSGHDALAGESERPGATLREGLISRVFWILVTVLFCSSIAQNGARPHGGLVDRSRRIHKWCGARCVRDGRSQFGRPASDRLAPRSLFCGACVDCPARGCSARDVLAFRRAIPGDGRRGCRDDRDRHGGRSRCDAVHPFPILRAAVVLLAVRLHLEGLCMRRGTWSGSHGQSVRPDRLLRSPSRKARSGDARGRDPHVVHAALHICTRRLCPRG
jgi:hypothetical protein